MAVSSFDHLYLETGDWQASCAFWQDLGFTIAEEWGSDGHRAARLVGGTAQIVLAEAPARGEPAAFDVVFRVGSLDTIPPKPEVEVVTEPSTTHWGTRMMRVKDPDGRVYSLEEGTGGG